MDSFISYLDKIESLIKNKKCDEAWNLANEGLVKIKGDDRNMMYYQMAIISAREKKWLTALEKMGFVIHYLGGLGGISHEKFILRLLKKFRKENLLNDFIEVAIKLKPRDFSNQLPIFLGIQKL